LRVEAFFEWLDQSKSTPVESIDPFWVFLQDCELLVELGDTLLNLDVLGDVAVDNECF